MTEYTKARLRLNYVLCWTSLSLCIILNFISVVINDGNLMIVAYAIPIIYLGFFNLFIGWFLTGYCKFMWGLNP